MSASPIINNTASANFITTNNQIYILGRFDTPNMAEVIGHLGHCIEQLQPFPQYNLKTKLVSPYDTDKIKNPIIDIFIDSPGGEVHTLNSITTLLNIAKARGAIIRTTVLAQAFSCGSLLAIQGTPGFRIMSSDAELLVHYGTTGLRVDKQSDLDAMPAILTARKQQTNAKYLAHTKISQRELNKLLSNESGFLSAKKCLELGFCDWIIDANGLLSNRTHSR